MTPLEMYNKYINNLRMSNKKTKWYCQYSISKNCIRANGVIEPHEYQTEFGGYDTKDQAENAFSKELDYHVYMLIRKIKYHGMNKTLRKRLIKYGNTKALLALDKTEQLLAALPDLNYMEDLNSENSVTKVIYEEK